MCTTVRYRIGLIDGLALFLPCWHLTNLVCLLRAIQHIAYTMEKCLLICNDFAIQGMTTYVQNTFCNLVTYKEIFVTKHPIVT